MSRPRPRSRRPRRRRRPPSSSSGPRRRRRRLSARPAHGARRKRAPAVDGLAPGAREPPSRGGCPRALMSRSRRESGPRALGGDVRHARQGLLHVRTRTEPAWCACRPRSPRDDRRAVVAHGRGASARRHARARARARVPRSRRRRGKARARARPTTPAAASGRRPDVRSRRRRRRRRGPHGAGPRAHRVVTPSRGAPSGPGGGAVAADARRRRHGDAELRVASAHGEALGDPPLRLAEAPEAAQARRLELRGARVVALPRLARERLLVHEVAQDGVPQPVALRGRVARFADVHGGVPQEKVQLGVAPRVVPAAVVAGLRRAVEPGVLALVLERRRRRNVRVRAPLRNAAALLERVARQVGMGTQGVVRAVLVLEPVRCESPVRRESSVRRRGPPVVAAAPRSVVSIRCMRSYWVSTRLVVVRTGRRAEG